MQEHWFKTQRRASSVLKWAMDMSINPNTNLRCDRKTVNGTRWCEDHKDEWCDECGRHATHVRNDYLGKKITLEAVHARLEELG